MVGNKNYLTFAVDFDGTVVRHRYPNIGDDIPHAVRVLKRIVAAGHKIIINTVRGNNTYIHDAIDWYEKHNIPLYGINKNPEQTWTDSNKVYANFIIDDTAIGTPLCFDNGDPYVDWIKIEVFLEQNGILGGR